MKFVRILASVFAALIALSPVVGSAKGSHSGGAVHVKGYTKKDGTYVAPHYRSSPNGTKADNWSTKGNINPYTGKVGTKAPAIASIVAAPLPLEAKAFRIPERPPMPSIHKGMTKAAVSAVLGEPNLKSTSKWFYSGRGWVTFQSDVVVAVD